jgi:hypothetical protein
MGPALGIVLVDELEECLAVVLSLASTVLHETTEVALVTASSRPLEEVM